jgi:hypothetical protein
MPPSNLKGLINIFLDIINPLLLVLAGLSLLTFFRGLAVFIFKSGDAKEHENGKNLMIWGLAALFIMASLWGILSFLYGNFFTGQLALPLFKPK